jgi:hypothetical protein
MARCSISLKNIEEIEIQLWYLEAKANDSEIVNNLQKTFLEGAAAFIYIPNKIKEGHKIIDGSIYSIKNIEKIYAEWGAEIPEVINNYLKQEDVLIKPFIINSDLTIEENLEKIIISTAKELVNYSNNN